MFQFNKLTVKIFPILIMCILVYVQAINFQHLHQYMDESVSLPEAESACCTNIIFETHGYFLYFIFHVISGVFLRIICLPFQLADALYPASCNIFSEKISEEKMELGFFESDFLETGFTPITTNTYKKILNRAMVE